MMKQLASELSPALNLILHFDCQTCQISALDRLFHQTIMSIKQNYVAHSWQRQRQYALLSPMYLEAIQQIHSSPFIELFLKAEQWSTSPPLDCPRHSLQVHQTPMFIDSYHQLLIILSEIVN